MNKESLSISVFKTNVYSDEQAKHVLDQIQSSYPAMIVNFDLEDCDKILRLEGENYQEEDIVSILNRLGFSCQILPFI